MRMRPIVFTNSTGNLYNLTMSSEPEWQKSLVPTWATTYRRVHPIHSLAAGKAAFTFWMRPPGRHTKSTLEFILVLDTICLRGSIMRLTLQLPVTNSPSPPCACLNPAKGLATRPLTGWTDFHIDPIPRAMQTRYSTLALQQGQNCIRYMRMCHSSRDCG